MNPQCSTSVAMKSVTMNIHGTKRILLSCNFSIQWTACGAPYAKAHLVQSVKKDKGRQDSQQGLEQEQRCEYCWCWKRLFLFEAKFSGQEPRPLENQVGGIVFNGNPQRPCFTIQVTYLIVNFAKCSRYFYNCMRLDYLERINYHYVRKFTSKITQT